ncbi:MAG: CAP domain-containing protein [Patescibacteria group bacterium]|nr:CAP domain-containing protein [Patescibacteria group bacterium]
MKKTTQILIVIFVFLSFYIIKDDLKIAYNKVIDIIENNKVDVSKNIFKEIKSSEEVVNLKRVITTPGALRVSNSVLSLDIKSVDLSVSEVIAETNKKRGVSNLTSLKENSRLNISAEKKLLDMFNRQYFDHISPTGKAVSNLVEEIDYDYIIVGENLAMGNFKNNKSLLEAWMNSPGHRANILNSSYQEIGVAVGKGYFEGEEVWIAVQHFGLNKSACPEIDSFLRGQINLEQVEIERIKEDLSVKYEQIKSRAVINGKTANEQIKEYNLIVSTYNDLVYQLKIKINKYNFRVKEFNSCVESYVGQE